MKISLTKDLVPLRAAATDRIYAFSETVRQRFVTPGQVQQQVYRQKLDEAQALVATAAPDPADYPMLSAEVGITAQTLQQVAQVILNTAALWTGIAARIEAIRYGARDAIAAAATPAAIFAAESEARASLDAFNPSSPTP